MKANATFDVQNLFDFPIFFNDLTWEMKMEKRLEGQLWSCMHTFFWNASLTSLMGKGVRKVTGCNGVFQKDCNMLLPLVRSWKYGCFMIGDGSYILTNLWGAQVGLVAASEAWRSNDKKVTFLNCVMLGITNARQKWVCDIMLCMMHWMFKFGH